MSIGSISDKLSLFSNVKQVGFNDAELSPITKTEPAENTKSFSEFLINKLGEVNEMAVEADQKLQHGIVYGDPDPHTTMLALQKADISFRLLMSMKEKIVQSYQEILRLQM